MSKVIDELNNGQRFKVFPDNKRTCCGDCGKVLTDEKGRVEGVHFYKGVRCDFCYSEFVKKENE